MTYPPIIPYLSVSDAAGAIEFYKKAFAAEVPEVHHAPGSPKIMHARVLVNGGLFMLSDDFSAEFGTPCETPKALGGCPVTLHLQMDHVDDFWKRAVAAGALVMMPLADQFWGDRYGQLQDPYGHKWSLGQTIKTMSASEMEEAAKVAFPAEA